MDNILTRWLIFGRTIASIPNRKDRTMIDQKPYQEQLEDLNNLVMNETMKDKSNVESEYQCCYNCKYNDTCTLDNYCN